jgi:hypothetical protein
MGKKKAAKAETPKGAATNGAARDGGSRGAAAGGEGPAYGILLSADALRAPGFVAHLKSRMDASDGLAPLQLPAKDSEGDTSRLVLVYLSASKLEAAKRDGFTRAQASCELMECILDVTSDESLKKVLPKSFHGEIGRSLLKACKSVGYVESFFPIHDTAIVRAIWRSPGWGLLEAPVEEMRDYFGEEIAFYFAWVGFYSKGGSRVDARRWQCSCSPLTTHNQRACHVRTRMCEQRCSYRELWALGFGRVPATCLRFGLLASRLSAPEALCALRFLMRFLMRSLMRSLMRCRMRFPWSVTQVDIDHNPYAPLYGLALVRARGSRKPCHLATAAWFLVAHAVHATPVFAAQIRVLCREIRVL